MLTLEARQIALEQLGIEEGLKRYAEAMNDNGASSTDPGKHIVRTILPRLADAIVDFLNAGHVQGKAGRRSTAIPYLVQIDPLQAAYLTIRYALDAASGEERVRFSTVAMRVGTAIEEHLNLVKLAEESPGLYRKVMDQVKRSPAEHIRRGVLRHIVDKYGKVKLDWRKSNKALVGAKLLELLADLFANEDEGLLRRVNVRRADSKDTYLELTEAAREYLAGAAAKDAMWYPVHLPMLVPPREWQLFGRPYGPTWDKRGGYLSDQMARFQLLQAKSVDQVRAADANPPAAVLTAVNAVQATPWRINKALLAVVKDAWLGGQRFEALLVEPERALPVRPAHVPEGIKEDDMTPDQKEAFIVWKRDMSEAYAHNNRRKGKRIAMEKKLWVAEKFLPEEAMYFPHYVDFRGRIYPFASYLNPQSDDSGRAMLEFAQGKPLGTQGMFWLKVHVANLFGVDKVPYAERVQWVNTNMEKLMDSAAAPLDGAMFWTEADSPWCALAALMELAGATVAGADYVSHLPIAMDGSCSGLQHYSAMLRDPTGGAAVNLVPADKPGDIYTEVAKRAQCLVDRSDIGESQCWKGGKVVRKIAKQPTMTLCYSATLYGMQQQIEKAVRGLGGEDYLLTDDLRSACTYMAGVVWDAIGETVVAARAAMDFLKEVANVTAEADLPIRWTAPSGFMVVQDYRVNVSTTVNCHYKGERLRFNVAEDGDTRDRKRQAAGVAPNFVHSLDSAHLMATVNRGTENDLYDWACIHDSFGVHACDVDTLHACIRDTFIEQYTPHVLAKLREEIVEQLSVAHPQLAAKVPAVPPQGTLDLEAVRDSAYFFA